MTASAISNQPPPFHPPSLGENTIKRSPEEEWLHGSSEGYFSHLLNSFDQPEKLREFWDQHLKGEWQLYYNGRADFSLRHYFRSIVANQDKAVFEGKHASKEELELAKGLEEATGEGRPAQVETISYKDFGDDWTWIGRTRVRKKTDGRLECVKFIRNGESKDSIYNEFHVTQYLENSQRMKSQMPHPIRVVKIIDIPDQAPNNIRQTFSVGYHFEAPGNYYAYLTEQQDRDAFIAGLKLWLEDTITLLHSNASHISTDLYHNESAQRPYCPGAAVLLAGFTAGRLENPFKGVSYPNAGLCGGRDWGDLHSLNALDFEKKGWRRDAILGLTGPVDFHADAFSKLMLVNALIQVQRLRKMGELDWENQDQVNQLASDLRESFVFALHKYFFAPLEKCRNFAEKGPTDWTMMAKEWLFWSNEKKYLPWIKSGKLPEGLYRKGIAIVLDTEKDFNMAKNYTPENGYKTNGEIDFGATNGPLPLVEFELAIDLFTTLALSLRSQFVSRRLATDGNAIRV